MKELRRRVTTRKITERSCIEVSGCGAVLQISLSQHGIKADDLVIGERLYSTVSKKKFLLKEVVFADAMSFRDTLVLVVQDL